jgi:glycosyltransferase involved in cell wall biosynthesis
MIGKKALVVQNKRTRFVKLDESILAARFEVKDWHVTKTMALNPFAVRRMVSEYDLILGWFASWHTFLPVFFAKQQRKPVIMVSGGYDVANLPKIKYGHQRGGLKKWVARMTLRMADIVVVNSAFSKKEAVENAGQDPDHVKVIYHGVPDTFADWETIKKSRQALTVGNVDAGNLWRKGHAPFIQAAPLLPDVQFVLVGDWQDDTHIRLKKNAAPNVCLTGWVNDQEWKQHYLNSAVYVQVSQHEGFGMSLAEGMLAGCFPVVTRAGAIPEVVGELGYFSEDTSAPAVAEGIRRGLSLGQPERKMIRERILQQFSMERRTAALFDLIDTIL